MWKNPKIIKQIFQLFICLTSIFLLLCKPFDNLNTTCKCVIWWLFSPLLFEGGSFQHAITSLLLAEQKLCNHIQIIVIIGSYIVAGQSGDRVVNFEGKYLFLVLKKIVGFKCLTVWKQENRWDIGIGIGMMGFWKCQIVAGETGMKLRIYGRACSSTHLENNIKKNNTEEVG